MTPASCQETPETGKKPVIVYILILFLAAFLLMFLSMLSHQRSNTEALGQAAEFCLRHSGDPGNTGADHRAAEAAG